MEAEWRELVVEIRLPGHDWQKAGMVRLLGDESAGTATDTEFWYDLDYATDHLNATDYYAVSSSLPVSFEPQEFEGWPPFLLDLFPQGAALKHIVDHYRIADLPANYWKILKKAKISPPGNLRLRIDSDISQHQTENAAENHPGFSHDEVIEKGPDFLEYMIEQGAPISGSTGPGGAAPKFILREDRYGKFHADGVLPDNKTVKCWLVKFPRGKDQIDKDILNTEKSYMQIAAAAGLQVNPHPLEWQSDCLFIPRFDRVIRNGSVEYLGMESFYSLVGSSQFASRFTHETYINAIMQYSSSPKEDVLEYVLRDLLNIVLGNTDNHGRNQSMLKGDGWTRLSPLYDFAPMKSDPEGIPRNTRWSFEKEDKFFFLLTDFLSETCSIDAKHFKKTLAGFCQFVTSLDRLIDQFKIPKDIYLSARPERESLIARMASFTEAGK